ncbi:MAG: hypothetical protein J6N79_05910, partial [Psychrobacter sp.]|nr:hypothetical protein [Psychrobacter sp.]
NPFTGTFDGQFHTVSGITVSGVAYGGLFGYTSGATIKNVGVSNGSITATTAGGGIVGHADATTLTNVFNEGLTVIGSTTNKHLGGIVGEMIDGSIDTAYNTATVGVATALHSGGIAGQVYNVDISHAYNTGTVENGIVGSSKYEGDASNITDVYTTVGGIGSTSFSPEPGAYTSLHGENAPKATMRYVADYEGKLSSISNQGYDGTAETDTVWRIYEGQSLPLLRAFLKGHGTVNVNYNYAQGNNTGSRNGQDLSVEYNGNDIALSNIYYTTTDDAAFTPTSGIITAPTNNVIDGNITSKNYISDGNVRTLAAFYTGQQGYDLVGNNYTINQKTVTIDSSSITATPYSRAYNGTNDATDAVKNFSYGGADGIVDGDIAKGKVSIDTSGVKAYFVGSSGNITDSDAADVGGNKTIAVIGGVTINNGDGYHNYILTGNASFGTETNPTKFTGNSITQKAVTIGLNTDTGINKEYDGKTKVLDTFKPSAQIAATVTGLTTGSGDSAVTQTISLTYAEDAHYVDSEDSPTK